MKLERFYKKAVEVGIANDPRSADEIKRLLSNEAESFKDIKEDDRKAYDKDRLFNPFADTRVLHGDLGAEVTRIMVGIDIDTSELLLAHTLNRDHKAGIDLVLGHHPMGEALVRMFDVMRLQSSLLAFHGVAVSVAEQLMDQRMGEVERRLLPINATREIDAARLLGLPLMCIHTAADNCVNHFLTGLFEREKPARLKDLLKLLRAVPEYDKAVGLQMAPKIVSGSEGASCGRILLEMTGGTSGSKDIYDKLAAAGVSTLVGMHISEEHLTNAKKANLNVVIAGHIASDVLGLNLLFDEIEKEAPLEFVGVSGFERIRR
ncbi:MAG: NGG1p interacting factor NIF3 [Candidatus Aminicenantes bacterium]|nr:NGG1p interacting factor NIF3 [Candidatus Aminicenantes bacterium]